MYKSLILAVVTLASFVAAQTTNSTTGGLGQVPACAQTCIYLPQVCNLDPKCICNDVTWINDISCCVFQKCSTSDQAAALAYAQNVCTPVGATLPQAASCANATSNSTSASASAKSSGSSASATAKSSGLAGQIYVPATGGIIGAIVGALALL